MALPKAEFPTKAKQYASRSRPSMPIEIPSRRKAVMAPFPPSPIGRPMSPDLLFEMSPVSSDFPSPAHYSFGFSTSQSMHDHEPFMYHFPMFSDINPSHRAYQRSKTSSAIYSRPLDNVTRTKPNPKQYYSAIYEESEDNTSYASSTALIKTPATTKITGFVPIIPIQPSIPLQPSTPAQISQPSKRLLLPRSSSFSSSSSPWTVSSKDDFHDEDIASVETNSTPFEFEKYLMRCIENRKPTRIHGLQGLF